MSVHLPWGSTVEYLIGHLSLPTAEVQMALVNGSPATRSLVLSQGDQVILASAH
jgi:hypothetical protein